MNTDVGIERLTAEVNRLKGELAARDNTIVEQADLLDNRQRHVDLLRAENERLAKLAGVKVEAF